MSYTWWQTSLGTLEVLVCDRDTVTITPHISTSLPTTWDSPSLLLTNLSVNYVSCHSRHVDIHPHIHINLQIIWREEHLKGWNFIHSWIKLLSLNSITSQEIYQTRIKSLHFGNATTNPKDLCLKHSCLGC